MFCNLYTSYYWLLYAIFHTRKENSKSITIDFELFIFFLYFFCYLIEFRDYYSALNSTSTQLYILNEKNNLLDVFIAKK